jgi:hypothetical protein
MKGNNNNLVTLPPVQSSYPPSPFPFPPKALLPPNS